MYNYVCIYMYIIAYIMWIGTKCVVLSITCFVCAASQDQWQWESPG